MSLHNSIFAGGLSAEEVAKRQLEFGPNALLRVRRTSALRVLLRQFTGLLVVILLIAAIIAFILQEPVDTAAILLVVVLNGVLGFVQEWRAENAIEALRNMLAATARVVRDGREQAVDARALVPGDLVIVEAGDRVPADLELMVAMQLRIDESVLTGESLPVEKSVARASKLFMGTSVVAGRAEGQVQATGMRTEFGQIADLTGSVGAKITQLQQTLGRLAQQMGTGAVGIAAVIILIGTLTGRGLVEMFMTGLSLAVAIVPEGLPAVVTITLALGASAMVRQKALARRLQAVETLGAASVICTDKTGTLTENKMTAAKIWMPTAAFEVTGTGYDPAGHIETDGQHVRAVDDLALAALLQSALVCSHASLSRSGEDWVMTGSPTEGALVTLAYKGWARIPDANARISELPFSSERKRMHVLACDDGQLVTYAKGAPEQILAICDQVQKGAESVPLGDAEAARIRSAYEAMAGEGLRVIALARRLEVAETRIPSETGLSFLGLVGLIDPPRPEVRAAIEGARGAGINIIMITGDSPVTASAIAGALGLAANEAITGADIEAMSDPELKDALRRQVLFARAAPAHKMRIVRCLQAQQQIVAMTGDGVNDAPALKQADIGVAMGIRGTDVAKDAADLVLLDDNFATIVRAIAEGRRQFDNVRKFVRYLLSSNAGEVIAIVINLLVGGPLVFLATQILWMNLVTDGVTAIALGVEKAEAGQMKRPPRAKDTPILGKWGLATIGGFGLYTGMASLWIFYTLLPQGEDLARTAAFTAMVVFEKVSVFAFRSLSLPCLALGWFSNRALLLALAATFGAQIAAVYWSPLQTLLHTQALGLAHWGVIALLALPLVIVPEIFKWGLSRRAAVQY